MSGVEDRSNPVMKAMAHTRPQKMKVDKSSPDTASHRIAAGYHAKMLMHNWIGTVVVPILIRGSDFEGRLYLRSELVRKNYS